MSFWRTQGGLGRTFCCAGCGASLAVSPVASLIPTLMLFTVFWFGREHFPAAWGGAWGLFALILLVGVPFVWAISRARVVS